MASDAAAVLSRGAQRRQARSEMYAISTDQPVVSDFSYQSGRETSSTSAPKICQKCLSKSHWTYECKSASSAYMARPSRSAFLQGVSQRGQYSGPVAPPPEAMGRGSFLLRPGNPEPLKKVTELPGPSDSSSKDAMATHVRSGGGEASGLKRKRASSRHSTYSSSRSSHSSHTSSYTGSTGSSYSSYTSYTGSYTDSTRSSSSRSRGRRRSSERRGSRRRSSSRSSSSSSRSAPHRGRRRRSSSSTTSCSSRSEQSRGNNRNGVGKRESSTAGGRKEEQVSGRGEGLPRGGEKGEPKGPRGDSRSARWDKK